jgi:hypothetical protein
MLNAQLLWTIFGNCNFQKVRAAVGRSVFRSQSVKNAQHSGQFRRCGFCSGFTKNTRRGTGKDSVFVAGGYKNFNKDSLLVAGTVQLTCPVRRSRRWFFETGYILRHQIFTFVEVIAHDKCGTSYDLASHRSGRHCTAYTWVRGRQALLRKVLRKCFVVNVVNVEFWSKSL